MRKISSRITNEVQGVNRVVYDVSSKRGWLHLLLSVPSSLSADWMHPFLLLLLQPRPPLKCFNRVTSGVESGEHAL